MTPALARTWRVHAFDPRGHGRSDRPGEYSRERHVVTYSRYGQPAGVPRPAQRTTGGHRRPCPQKRGDRPGHRLTK